MKKQFKSLSFVCTAAALLATSETAMSMQSSDYKIETVASKVATLTNVRLLKISDSYIIKGRVRSKIRNRRAAISGHVDVSVVASDGQTLNTRPAAIYRINKKSRYARFIQPLKFTPADGSIIRVAHHNAPLGVNATELTNIK